MLKYFKYSVVAGLLLLSGCINVKEDIVLNLNGSGSMHLSYYIPDALMKDPESLRHAMVQTGIEFPLTVKDFNGQFAGLEGVAVKSVKASTDKGYYILDGTVKFRSLNDVRMNNVQFRITTVEHNRELTITLINSMNKPQGTHSQSQLNYENILKGSLANYGIKFKVSFPTKVISANGNIKDRDVAWNVPMNVFLKSQAKKMELRAVYSGRPTILDRIKDFFRL